MKRWQSWRWQVRGRDIFAGYDLPAFPLPRVAIGAECNHGEECETRYVALSFGTKGADPVVYAEIHFERTRAGYWLAEVAWWFRERRWRGPLSRIRDTLSRYQGHPEREPAAEVFRKLNADGAGGADDAVR